ncbi:efflux transporter outer membrane subunit [Sulfurospirillum diekertiae]|uniref:Outer membrane protein OprM n=1 Tax=Sulfurospirillum diekertiae TaxID=1854492 RepID=A0A1Y0HPA3_9BACT|nr:efflux transporter outer membrane subunit [Sulfurospirillum diekertiae]ARU49938.1 Outer membrane protein OprM [Sulfurospirillum diekertiae]ASC94727.1 Outer membrane protein OprM [Sulfurospirillum diekertiae]
MRYSILSILLVTNAFFVGCAQQNTPSVPTTVTIPQAYHEEGNWKKATPNDNAVRGAWWEMYHDAELNTLMEALSRFNPSISKYEALYKQALAVVESSQASLFPTLSVGADISRSQTSAGVNSTNKQKRSTDYKLPLQASWTPDIWGDTRHLVDAYSLSAEASLNDLEAAKLSAQTLLAQNYFQLRNVDVQEAFLHQTLEAYEKSLKITQNQYNAGIVTKKDVITAQAQMKSVEAQKIDLHAQRQQLEHAIAALIGKTPSEFSIQANPKLPIVLPDIPYSLPSELLERRPDIAAAERRMKQTNIQVGIAQDAWFPTFNLTASSGYESNVLSSLISKPNLIWAVGGALSETIFDAGLREANLKQIQSTYEANIATYRQSVLTAFQQVEDALATLETLSREVKVQQEAVDLAQQVFDFNMYQYRQGIVNYTSVVVAQTSLLNNQITVLNLQNRQVLATISLISALGGNFQ